MAPEYKVDEDQKIGELVFLKLFHIFIQVISDSNNGSANLQSIIQDYLDNWDGFYEASLQYIEKFMKAAKNLGISPAFFKQEGKYVIRIELPDDWIRKDLGDKDSGVALKTNTGQIKTLISTLCHLFSAGIFASGTPPEKPDCDIREPDLGYFNGANPEEHISNAEKDYEKLEKAVEVEQTTLPQSSMKKSETQRSKIISSTGEAELESGLKESLKNAELEIESDESTITEDGAAILQLKKTDNTENGDEEETNETIELQLHDKAGNQREKDEESKDLEGNSRNYAKPHSSDVDTLAVEPLASVAEERPQQDSAAEDFDTFTNDDHISDAEEAYENYHPNENPFGAQNGSGTSIDTLSMIQEGDRTVIETKKVAQNFEKPPVEGSHPATPPKTSYLDDVFSSMSKKEELEVVNGSKQDEMIAKMTTEIAEQSDITDLEGKTENLRNDLESDRISIETDTKTLYSPKIDAPENDDKENEEFQKKLEEQRKIHKEELEQKRQERAEKQRKMDDEFKELRHQQRQRFCMLLQCIQWRQRFTEKEEDWSDWIKNGFRRPIEMLINQFADFREELGFDSKKFRKLLEASPETVESEALDFQGKLELSLFSLESIFTNLSKVGSDFEDAIFVRILQKTSCEMANKVVDVLKLMDTIEYTEIWYKEVEESFTRIRANDIPGTQKLKEMCKDCNMEDYKNLEFPIWDWKSHVKFEEVSSYGEEEVWEEEKKTDVADESVEVVENKSIEDENGPFELPPVTSTNESSKMLPEEVDAVSEELSSVSLTINDEQLKDGEHRVADYREEQNSSNDQNICDVEDMKSIVEEIIAKIVSEEGQADFIGKGEAETSIKVEIYQTEPNKPTVPLVDKLMRNLRDSLNKDGKERFPSPTNTKSMESEQQQYPNTRSRARSSTNPDVFNRTELTRTSKSSTNLKQKATTNVETKKSKNSGDIRSKLLSLHKDLFDSDKPRYKLEDSRHLMKIIVKGKMSKTVTIWNRIVEDTTRCLNYEEFVKLVGSKLPDILKEEEVEQVTDC